MQSLILYEPDLKIERTFRLRKKKQRIEEQRREVRRNPTNMAGGRGDQRRALWDFVIPGAQGIASSITCPNIDANNFELKLALISMVQQSQFGWTPLEDPSPHLLVILELCGTLKVNEVSTDTVRIHLFPSSLRDKARTWLHSLPSGCITT